MTIKYIIVDDEPIAHSIIKKYGDMVASMQLMHSCYDAIEALEYLNEHSIDLIFLDLNMPKLKGFEFLRTLDNAPKVIVTTAYSEHALEGYELNVVDYLLKPFSFERFLKAVNKISRDLSNSKTKPSSQLIQEQKLDRIFLTANKKRYQIKLDEVIFAEASGNYTKIILENETISIREKFSNVLDLLPKENFVRVHRSFLVSIQHIKQIEGLKIILTDDVVPIGKSYKAALDERLKNL